MKHDYIIGNQLTKELFQGGSIEEDLKARDFTITSMGLDILQEDNILDLFGGAQDLKDGVVRATSTRALQDDPLRCVRAVRLAAQFQFRILPETQDQIRQHQHLLTSVSPERIRDELFRILAGPHQIGALMSLNQLGTYQLIFRTKLTPKQQHIIRWLESFWSLMSREHDQESAANLSLGVFVHRLGRYREEIRNHINDEPVPGRSIYQLSFLVPLLFPDLGGEGILLGKLGIPLSNKEYDRVIKSRLAWDEFLSKSSLEGELPALSVYRYFRGYGFAGVEGIFLGLADLISDIGSTDEVRWLNALDTARSLLDGWWDQRDLFIDPPGLLDGHDLQHELGVEPGPLVGKLLEELREAQVSTGLNTRELALDFIRKAINTKDRV